MQLTQAKVTIIFKEIPPYNSKQTLVKFWKTGRSETRPFVIKIFIENALEIIPCTKVHKKALRNSRVPQKAQRICFSAFARSAEKNCFRTRFPCTFLLIFILPKIKKLDPRFGEFPQEILGATQTF